MPTPPPAAAVPVTVDNFNRAETDRYFALFASRGALGTFVHQRALPLAGTGVRPNRDTLYSEAVFDLDAGPVTLTLPDAGARFLSLMVIDQDHYVALVAYGPGSHTLARDQIGTRYVFAAVRILVDPTTADDVQQVHALQDAIQVRQPGVGTLELPTWDAASQAKVRDALLVLNETLPDLRRAAGRRGEVDPVRHLIATAAGWGLNPDTDAIYLTVTPADNDGTTVYRLTVTDVPVDGFWSVTVYDASGHFQQNRRDAYSVNNLTATPAADGSVTIQFGGCDDGVANCLPIMAGWNYLVRLYRPRQAVLDGSYTFPAAQAVR